MFVVSICFNYCFYVWIVCTFTYTHTMLCKRTSYLVFSTVNGMRITPAIVLATPPIRTDSSGLGFSELCEVRIYHLKTDNSWKY